MAEGDYYDELGVDRGASKGVIKKAYRKKAKELHPDKGGTVGDFQALQRAYSVLSNETLREHYDRTGDDQDRTLDQGEQRFLRELTVLIDRAINQGNNFNFIVAVKLELKQGKSKCARTQSDAQKALDRVERLKGRLTTKRTDNLFDIVLGHRQSMLENIIETAQNEIKEIEAAIAFADSYKDAQVDPVAGTTSSATAITGAAYVGAAI